MDEVSHPFPAVIVISNYCLSHGLTPAARMFDPGVDKEINQVNN
jgi:hypothetical protein